ncbi:50S ribosomal protein L11 methyltransferase, partial [Neisseria gonorrhoeae]
MPRRLKPISIFPRKPVMPYQQITVNVNDAVAERLAD